MNIGNKRSDLRKEKGLSRDVLGKLVGTSGAVISRYERKEITPSIDVAKKMADALEVSLDYLTGGTSSMIKDKKNALSIRTFAKGQPKRTGYHFARIGFPFANSTAFYNSTKINVIMNLQYISDNTGKTTGVFIPISEWNELKNKYKDIEQIDIPNCQTEEVRKRLDDYKNNPEQALDFDAAMDDIEKDL